MLINKELFIENGNIIINERIVEQYSSKNILYKRIFKKRIVKPWKSTNGYLIFSYKFKRHYVHRFIWEYYNNMIIPNEYVIHHIDENIYNNDISNLELKLNSTHTKEHMLGKHPYKSGKKIICITTGEIFNSVNEAAEKLNVKNCSISRVLTGYRKNTKGLEWKYF